MIEFFAKACVSVAVVFVLTTTFQVKLDKPTLVVAGFSVACGVAAGGVVKGVKKGLDEK